MSAHHDQPCLSTWAVDSPLGSESGCWHICSLALGIEHADGPHVCQCGAVSRVPRPNRPTFPARLYRLGYRWTDGLGRVWVTRARGGRRVWELAS